MPARKPKAESKTSSEAKIEANRKNAQKSTGPKTEAGKAVSRFNAVKHGACAKTTVLPTEDAEAYEERRRRWHEDFRPRGIIEAELLDLAVESLWRFYRARNTDTASVSEIVVKATQKHDRERQNELKKLIKELPDNPAEVSMKLRETVRGCAWVATQLETMIEALEVRGWWYVSERDLVLNIFGLGPQDLFKSAEAYDIMIPFLQVGWSTDGEATNVQALIRTPAPEGMATWEYRHRIQSVAKICQVGDPEVAKAKLIARLFPEIEKLTKRMEELRPREDYLRSGVVDRASLDLSAKGQLRMRYETGLRREVRNAVKDVVNFRKIMEQKGMRDEEPETPRPMHVEVPARNEPNKALAKLGNAPSVGPDDGFKVEETGSTPSLVGPSVYANPRLGLTTNVNHTLIGKVDPSPKEIRRYVAQVHEAMFDFDYDEMTPI